MMSRCLGAAEEQAVGEYTNEEELVGPDQGEQKAGNGFRCLGGKAMGQTSQVTMLGA